MPGTRRAWATVPALVAAAGIMSSARPALADEIEVIAVEYEAASTCGPEERFLDNVRRYTTRWTKAPSPRAALRTFRIVVGERRGELVVRELDGKTSRRELTAPDCERVARGIAIAMALAIDPEADITGMASPAATERPATNSRNEGDREPRRPGRDGREEDGAETRVEETPSSPPAIAPPPARNQPHGRELASRRPWSFALEARAELTSSIAAAVAPTFGVAAEARANVFQDALWLGPAVAIGVRQSWPAVVEAPTSSKSEFVWTAASVRACPMGIHVQSAAVDVVPCVEGNAGTLRARALPDGQTRPSTWFDLGGSLRATLRIGNVWALGAAALVSSPFIRHRFALVGGGLVSQPPEVGLTAGIVLERRL